MKTKKQQHESSLSLQEGLRIFGPEQIDIHEIGKHTHTTAQSLCLMLGITSSGNLKRRLVNDTICPLYCICPLIMMYNFKEEASYHSDENPFM